MTEFITKEQEAYLHKIYEEEKTMEKIDYNKVEKFFDKVLLPYLNKYKFSYAESTVLAFGLIYLNIIKQQERLKYASTDLTKPYEILLDSKENQISKQSREVRDIISCVDVISKERGKGYSPKSNNDIFISNRLLERFEILDKFKCKCVYCGRSPPEVSLELDHVIPKSKGGTNDRSNLVPACFDCNNGKRAKIISDEVLNRLKKEDGKQRI